MKSPWSSLEEVPTLAAVAAEWRGHMGDAFEAFCAGKLLEKAGRRASSFPCPHKFGCTHEVKPRGNGFVGKSKDDDGVGCDDIPLTAEDVEVWELNRSRLGRAIAWALESEPRELRLLVPRTIQVASFGDGAVSVLLTLPQSRDEFQEVITGLVAESGQPFVLVGPTNRFVDRRCRELLEKRNAEFLDLASCFEIQADGGLRARRPVRELLARFLPSGRGTSKGSEGKRVGDPPRKGGTFYLFASPAGEADQTGGAVFYKVQGRAVAEGLCGLFKKEYGGGDGRPTFSCVAAESIAAPDQVLLDEAIGWLEVYDDPDPGVYEPEPSKDMIVRAQYGVRAGEWEPLLREKVVGGDAGGSESQRKEEDFPPVPWGDGLGGMPEEDRRNGALGLLMLLAQAYYRLLEAGTHMGGLGATLDLELNHAYFWTVKNLRNLLGKHPDLKDFPVEFNPALPDLYPSRTRDLDWVNELAPAAEDFLSRVQEYVMAKGMHEAEEKSPAWIFIELFRPGINDAIVAAAAYKERMSQFCQEVLDAAGGSPAARPGASAPEAGSGETAGSGDSVDADKGRGVRGGPRVPEYVIKEEGTRRRAGKHDRTEVSTWRIWFRGHEVLMPAWVGTECLVYLMCNQGKEFAGDKLKETIRKSMPSGGSGSSHMASEILHGQDGNGDDPSKARGRIGSLNEPDLMWNEREIAACLRKVKAAKGEMGEHEKAGDRTSDDYLALKARLEEQQDLLRANAKEVKGKWVPKAYQKGTLKQMADAIRKDVRKVLDEHLRQNHRELFEHLNDKRVLRYGVSNWYRPKPSIPWEVQLKRLKKGM